MKMASEELRHHQCNVYSSNKDKYDSYDIIVCSNSNRKCQTTTRRCCLLNNDVKNVLLVIATTAVLLVLMNLSLVNAFQPQPQQQHYRVLPVTMSTSSSSLFLSSSSILSILSNNNKCSNLLNNHVTSRRTNYGGCMKKCTKGRLSTSLLYNQLVSYDEWMKQLPSQNIIDAIEVIRQKQQNNSNNKVTVISSDIASIAGISLSKAKSECMLLATLTSGDIAVDNDGELIYTYPTNIKQILNENSIKYKTTNIIRQIWPSLFWGIRISFGLSLFVSIAVIFSAIFFIQTSSSSSDRDDDRRGSGGRGGGGSMFGGGFGYYWGPTPFDLFLYRPYGSNSNSAYYTGDKDPDDMGILESVFSYVFGDGNPNVNIEETRIRLASNMIRFNNGAVTAEQLAPYCGGNSAVSTSTTFTDLPPSPNEMILSGSSSSYIDESYVLPLVSALNGEPQVTDDGDIIYIFPELQVSATTTTTPASSSSALLDSENRKRKEMVTLKRAGLRPDVSSRDIIQILNYNGISTRGILDRSELIMILNDVLPPLSERDKRQYQNENSNNSDPSILLERPYEFTLAPGINKLLAGGLGLFNLGGALYLGNILSQYINAYSTAGVVLPNTFIVLSNIYPFLLGYAILFNTIPLIRYFYIHKQNELIQKRNERRIVWRDAINTASSTSSASTSLSSSISNTASNFINMIRKKLSSAKTMKLKMKQISNQKNDNNIIFDTKQTSIETLSLQKENDRFDEFDTKLFENINK